MIVTAIGGVPAAGKTELMKRIINRLGKVGMAFPFKSGLIVGTQYPKSKIEIIGDYNTDNIFAGTDRLSMAVQPKFIQYLKVAKGLKQDFHIIFEGDRLFNGSLFMELTKANIDLNIFVLEVPANVQAERFKLRGSNQDEKFLRAKRTKVSNIVKDFGNRVQVFHNILPSDIELLADRILSTSKPSETAKLV